MSCIYELYLVDQSGNEITFYIGKTHIPIERVKEHIDNSIVNTNNMLYSFVNSLEGTWESVKFRVLHENLPDDSSHKVVCYFEKYYYQEKAKKFDMKNSMLQFGCNESIDEKEIEYYMKFQVPKGSMINQLVNAYKDQIVKNHKLTNVQELYHKYKLIVKDKSKLNEMNGLLKQTNADLKQTNVDLKQTNAMFSALKERNEAKIDELEKYNKELNQKILLCTERLQGLSENFIDHLKNTQQVSTAQICVPVIEKASNDIGEIEKNVEVKAETNNEVKATIEQGDVPIDPDWKSKLPTFVAVNKRSPVPVKPCAGKDYKLICPYCEVAMWASNLSRHKRVCPQVGSFQAKKQLEWLYAKFEKLQAENIVLKSEQNKLQVLNEMFFKGEVIRMK